MNDTILAIAEATNDRLDLDCPNLRFLYEVHNYVPYGSSNIYRSGDPRTAHSYIYDRNKMTDTAKLGVGRIDYFDTTAMLVIGMRPHLWHEDICFEYADPNFYSLLKTAVLKMTKRALDADKSRQNRPPTTI